MVLRLCEVSGSVVTPIAGLVKLAMPKIKNEKVRSNFP
jgi:hypothetical protein